MTKWAPNNLIFCWLDMFSGNYGYPNKQLIL